MRTPNRRSDAIKLCQLFTRLLDFRATPANHRLIGTPRISHEIDASVLFDCKFVGPRILHLGLGKVHSYQKLDLSV